MHSSLSWVSSGNLVVNALASVARGPRFAPRGRRGKFPSPNMFSVVPFPGMTLNQRAILWIGTFIGGPLCRENHPLCMLKNPSVVCMITCTCRLSCCKPGVYNVHLFIILERGCSSTDRKKVRPAALKTS